MKQSESAASVIVIFAFAAQQESFHGTLIADSISGGTINAERAFLTGFSYCQLSYHSTASSFVRYFSANGYTTVGAHSGHNWFYSRNKVTKRTGFDSFVFNVHHFEEKLRAENTYIKRQSAIMPRSACCRRRRLPSGGSWNTISVNRYRINRYLII